MHVSIKPTPADPAGRGLSRKAGFTLIEVILGMGIMMLLLGGVYAVAKGAVAVSTSVSQVQQREILVHNFLQLCRRTFAEIPGNGGVFLASDQGRGLETDILFTEYPLAFSWSGVPGGSSRTAFFSKKNARGSLDVMVAYINEDQEDEQEVFEPLEFIQTYRSELNSGRGLTN
ncbi:MAG: type II secretion system protein, partial [Verrucomicrobiota bacterium]